MRLMIMVSYLISIVYDNYKCLSKIKLFIIINISWSYSLRCQTWRSKLSPTENYAATMKKTTLWGCWNKALNSKRVCLLISSNLSFQANKCNSQRNSQTTRYSQEPSSSWSQLWEEENDMNLHQIYIYNWLSKLYFT